MVAALDTPFDSVCCAHAVTVFIKVNQINLTERVASDIYVKPINLVGFSSLFSPWLFLLDGAVSERYR